MDNTEEARRAIKRRAPSVSLSANHTARCRVLPDRLVLLEHLPKFGVVAEIGVGSGDYTREILGRSKPTRLHLVDEWRSERYRSGLAQIRSGYAEKLRSGALVINQGCSRERLAEFDDGYFDWVFIDTDHSYETTRDELLVCRDKIKQDGFIAGHDFCPGNVITPWPYGVIEACNEFCVEQGWQFRFLTLESHGHHSFALSRMSGATSTPSCNICGSTEFLPGFKGRLANGRPPMCATCKSVERHRIVRGLYDLLRPLLRTWRALHFSPDGSVDAIWFGEYLGSSWGGPNSMDMMCTGLPDARFDLVMSNHVLEHVEDDRRALCEMLRLVGNTGVVHLNVPTPTHRWISEDWGFPDPNVNEHYRDYGADFPQQMVARTPGVQCAAVAHFDPVTLAGDLVYFFSRSAETLASMAAYWKAHAVPITRLY